MAHVPKSKGLALQGVGPEGTPALDSRLGEEDRELVRRAKNDDRDAFERLVRRHQSRVFAVAAGILRNKEDVEDIAQQVFMKAYFSLKRFDQRAAFSTWLYKITVNECWDVLRKRKVRPLLFESDLSEEQETKERLEKLLDCLEERDRLMLVLKEVQGFSVEEIAEILEINGNTVKVRLFRARQRITEKVKRRRGVGI